MKKAGHDKEEYRMEMGAVLYVHLSLSLPSTVSMEHAVWLIAFLRIQMSWASKALDT